MQFRHFNIIIRTMMIQAGCYSRTVMAIFLESTKSIVVLLSLLFQIVTWLAFPSLPLEKQPIITPLEGAATCPARMHAVPRHNIQAYPCLFAMAEKVISRRTLTSWPHSRWIQKRKRGRESSRWRVAGWVSSVHRHFHNQEMSAALQYTKVPLGGTMAEQSGDACVA